jgi:hypothetical protein
VNGTRSGLVTGSRASNLLSLCVASADSATSVTASPSGTSRLVTQAAAASAPTTPT